MAPKKPRDPELIDVDPGVPMDNILEGVAELNLGQTARLLPSVNFDAAGNPVAVIGQPGEEVQLALLPDIPDSGRPQVVTFHLATFTPELGLNPNGIPIGIVEFSGGGAKLGRIEFDIPISRPFPPNWNITTAARRGLNNGVSVTVPMGGGKVLARNDANINFVTDPNVAVTGGLSGNIEVSAHVVRYPKFNRLQRTVFVAGAGATLADATAVAFGIPNYASRVRFPRNPMSSVLEVTVASLGGSGSVYTIPAGSLAPTPDLNPLEIFPDDFTMTVRNVTGGGVAVNSLRAVFDLAV